MRLDLRATQAERATVAMDAGCAVVYTSVPALSTTYALDAVTLDQIRAVASDAANGLGLPFGADYFSYPNKDHTQFCMFDANQIQDLYKALRDYVAMIQYYGAGQVSFLPPQPVTIA